MEEQRFRELVEEALDGLPEEYAKKLNNVGVIVEDWPTPQQRMKLRLPPWALLFGLYEGIPQTRRGGNYTMVLPDKITIFKYPMLSIARSFSDLKEIVKNTVWHEIAHHFGMDESAVRQAEKARIERLSKRRLYLKQ